MTDIYVSKSYGTEPVTGLFCRCEGKKPNYRFRMSEVMGPGGKGPTLREYWSDGSDIPDEIRASAIKSKHTTRIW